MITETTVPQFDNWFFAGQRVDSRFSKPHTSQSDIIANENGWLVREFIAVGNRQVVKGAVRVISNFDHPSVSRKSSS